MNINKRQRLFAETLATQSLQRAIEITGYSPRQVFRLLKDKKVKEFYMKITEELLSELRLSKKELIQEYYKLATNEKVSPATRERALANLIEWAGSAESKDVRDYPPPYQLEKPILSPSKTSFDELKAKKLANEVHNG